MPVQNNNNNNKFRYSIRVTVVSVFIFANILTASIAIGLQYYFSKSMATESALSLYNTTAENTRNYLATLDSKAVNTSKILSKYSNLIEGGWIKGQSRELFAQVLQNNPVFYAIYVGFDNGDLYELINLDSDPIVRNHYNALPQDRWIVVSIINKDGQRTRRYEFYDSAFKLRVFSEENSNYYANERPWFTNAKTDQTFKTDPYLFQILKVPGQTYSTVIPSTGAVLAIDIASTSLSRYLSAQKLSKDSEIYLHKSGGEIIATNLAQQQSDILLDVKPIALSSQQKSFIDKHPVIRISNSMDWAPIDFAVSGLPKGYVVDVVSIIAKMTGLQFQYINGFNWPQLVEKFKYQELDMLQAIYRNAENERRGIVSKPFLTLPFALITKPDVATITQLKSLNGRKLAIVKGWSITNDLVYNFPKINIIEFATLKEVIEAVRRGEADAGLDVREILHHVAQQFFIDDIKYHDDLSFQSTELPDDLHFLLQHGNSELAAIINLAISNITPKKQQALKSKWFERKGKISNKVNNGIVPYAEFIIATNNVDPENTFSMTEIEGVEYFVFSKTIGSQAQQGDVFSIITPVDKILDESLNEVKFSIAVTVVCLLLMLPISWFFASPIVNPIRLLAKQNDKIKMRRFNEIRQVESSITEIHELSVSLTDMSDAIQKQEQVQQELLDSFIRVISQAIDDKSPYTAGHCERVPKLAIMLADFAANSNERPFSGFSFDESERREFSIAAWLHDCGKVTTPEHIIDKGTKLEVIYNRIHEIRMRFEVLWRDAEIDYLKALNEEPDNLALLTERLRDKKASLVDDFEFIANANVGGEFMAAKDIERLKALSSITWQRYFDDTLGLSPIESARCQPYLGDFPVTENLLMDKAVHIIERDHEVAFDAKFNIKMDVPQHLYNNGELYNLSISRGTLTKEDRFKINEHIISTIKMLESLTFPPELAKVPRYASTHHETMKGTGYPRKLSAKDLSIPERIMVVADIFEALTAADRPYKTAKPVSVAIDILYKMALDNHIDMDIFKLLLSSGIYLEYAKRFLPTEQLDHIDIDKYLKQPVAEDCPV